MIGILKALADERRLRIAALLTRQELCVCELVASMRAAQYAVSRGLAGLKQAGIVSSRKEGKWVYYSLAGDKQDMIRELIGCLLRRCPDRVFAEDAERLAHRLRFRVDGKCIYGLEVGDCCQPTGASAVSAREQQ